MPERSRINSRGAVHAPPGAALGERSEHDVRRIGLADLDHPACDTARIGGDDFFEMALSLGMTFEYAL
jgi:hypothetical protein